MPKTYFCSRFYIAKEDIVNILEHICNTISNRDKKIKLRKEIQSVVTRELLFYKV